MKKPLSGLFASPAGHWVGDGFPVRSLFSYDRFGQHISPFLLLDYAGPRHFEPGSRPRGVGEHPHRGFETVTIVYQGEVAHRDSTGSGGTIGAGDVQWMTAAGGIVHEEFHSPAFMRSGGELEMVQPQRAAVNINCRIFPGETVEGTEQALSTAIADPGVKITPVPPIRPIAHPPSLDPKIVGPAEKLVKKYFPGVPLIPSMSTGATDGIYLEAIGIPVYGVPGEWGDPDGNGAHGLNERLSVRSALVGRDFLDELIRAYAERP